jgi:hypothetical protein
VPHVDTRRTGKQAKVPSWRNRIGAVISARQTEAAVLDRSNVEELFQL